MFEEDSTKYGKAWQNTEFFPYLNKNKEDVVAELMAHNIKNVKCFDQINPDWKEWCEHEKLTLVVMPLCNVIDQDGKETKKQIQDSGLHAKEKYVITDISTDEMCEQRTTIAWFKTRNLILTKANVFFDKEIFNLFLGDLDDMNPKFMTQDEIWSEKLEKEFSANIKNRIEQIKHSIQSDENTVIDYEQRYLSSIKKVRDNKQVLEQMGNVEKNISAKLRQQMEEMRALPIVKEVYFKDKIYVSFGDVSITANVVVDKKKIDGISVPVTEMTKVPIGELLFVIGGEEVKVENKTGQQDNNQHPHARDGIICWGEAKIKANKMLLEFELVNLVKLLYSWAFSYNEGDSYRRIQEWYDTTKRK